MVGTALTIRLRRREANEKNKVIKLSPE